MSPRHHTVPQVYLRNFAKASQVLLVDRDDLSRVCPTVVRKACAEVGFYRMDPDAFVLDESQRFDPEVIEHHLSQFETVAAPGIYKLARTGLADLTQEDWFHLINFIALQSVRGNRFREDMRATGDQALRVYLGQTVADDQIREWLKADGKPTTAASVSDFREGLLGPMGPRLVPPKEFLIQEGLKLALGSLNERLPDNMHWSVIKADQVSVLTSDDPVCWWAPGDDPVGFGSAQVVWFPVGRHRILQLSDKTVTPESLGLPDHASANGRDDLIRFVNGLVATQAHRWIVHHPDDDPLDDLVLGPRTAWANELVSVEETGTTRRELWIHRRLPVSSNQQASDPNAAADGEK